MVAGVTLPRKTPFLVRSHCSHNACNEQNTYLSSYPSLHVYSSTVTLSRMKGAIARGIQGKAGRTFPKLLQAEGVISEKVMLHLLGLISSDTIRLHTTQM